MCLFAKKTTPHTQPKTGEVKMSIAVLMLVIRFIFLNGQFKRKIRLFSLSVGHRERNPDPSLKGHKRQDLKKKDRFG